MSRRGFTLIELLVAVVISAVLMGGVLVVTAQLSRDARRAAQDAGKADLGGVVDLLQWDLTNARAMSGSADGRTLILVGHGAIDPSSLKPNGRLVRVTYLCQVRRSVPCLLRRQQYIDDPARPQAFTDLVASGVAGVEALPVGTEQVLPETQPTTDDASTGMTRVPAWVRLRIYGPSVAIERQLCVR